MTNEEWVPPHLHVRPAWFDEMSESWEIDISGKFVGDPDSY
jgi:hypothetical protein